MNMFPHTITIYHKEKQNGVERWLRSVVSGVLWNENKGSVMRKTGASSADDVTVYIPMAVLKDVQIADGDTIVKGDIAQEIAKSPKELAQGHLVTNVDIKDIGGAQAHCEVSAK